MIDLPVVASGTPADVSPVAAAFLRLLANPTRRHIFLQLMAGETCNCELVAQLGLPQNLVSHHLRRLHRAGLVQARRHPDDQRWIYYAVVPETLAAVRAELTGLFDPANLGTRVPQCGPERNGRSALP